MQYLNYTKKILADTHSEIVALGLIRRVVMGMDRDVKNNYLRIKASTVIGDILKYVKEEIYDNQDDRFETFENLFRTQLASEFKSIKIDLGIVLETQDY